MKHLLLIDANSLIHRMYHALPPLENNGHPTGALYGLSGALLKISYQISPDYAVALFDRPEPTFRKKEFEAYKAQRPKADDELIWQIIHAHDTFDAFSIPTLEKAGYEADDLIGTLSTTFKKHKGIVVTIFTGDLDTLQLVDDDKVRVNTFKKGISEMILYDEKGVKEKLGVTPTQVIDYKGLVGDTSDNIPGVHGIGPKTTVRILTKFQTIENYLEKGSDDKSFEHIRQHKDDALLSKKLATIITDVPVSINLDDAKFKPKHATIKKYFEKNGFTSLIKRLDGFNNTPSTTIKKHARANTKKTVQKPDNILLVGVEPEPSEKELLSDKLKIGYDLKPYLKKHEVSGPFFDVMIAGKLLQKKCNEWEECCKELFGELYDESVFLIEAYQKFSEQLQKEGVKNISQNIEMPLIPALAAMENNGMLVDLDQVKKIGKELSARIAAVEKKIHETIPVSVNLNSPKQLLKVLNDKLGLKLTSTSAKKLEDNKDKHPVLADILTYRELFKLKTTYIDAYKRLVKKDGRIHPTFLQLGASTGRLSCHNPNLQNIPARADWADNIRDIFVSPKGWSLASFDYSQIELRVLASVSGDVHMQKTFHNGGDIHALTASRVFSIPYHEVTSKQRRIAKTLNFGIIFGMGPRAFARQSGLSLQEAKQFIKKYFDTFSSVTDWQKKILTQARTTGRITNANGRFRLLPNIHSTNPRFSSEAERMALNMPLQGLAADIIKLAMINVFATIQKEYLDTVRMILTIHDELLFEINDNLLTNDTQSPIIKKIADLMEGAYNLAVPLKTDITIGKRWGQMR